MGLSASEDELISPQPNTSKRSLKRIVIFGMGRSGTSFLTGCLAKCGVYVDEVSDNFEHTRSRAINDTILQELYGARHGLPYGKLPAEEIKLPDIWHVKVREVVDSMEAHPVRQLYNAGVPIVINTDDPSFFQTTLTREYQLAAVVFNLPVDQLAANSFRYAFDATG